jgi:dienelactone hydrolase
VNRIGACKVAQAALAVLAALAILSGCSRQTPVTGTTTLKAANPSELQSYLLARKPELEVFRLRGPFRITPLKDVELRIASQGAIKADLYLCATTEKVPLVIVLHGHGNSKDDHIFHALHVATWGMHAIAIDLPNQGGWIAHGRTLTRLVDAVRKHPETIDSRVDVQRIVLVGHSFGATAVAAALGQGAAVSGAILLDPAGIGRQLPVLLKKVNVPVLVIGADEDVWPARNRDYFYRFIPASVAEISIRDAVHEDAQFPTEHTFIPPADGPLASAESQITFVAALSAAAFSLAATGTFDYAWASFDRVLAEGKFFNARRK